MERCIEEAMFRFGEMERTYDAEYKKQDAMKVQLEVRSWAYGQLKV